MAAAKAEDAEPSTVRVWNVGVRTRLLLAFLGISAFALLAAAAGIYSFGRVGDRLEVIDARVPPALAALELSRSAERIIAAAPALLAATDPAQRDEVKAGLEAEVARLDDKLGELRNKTDKASPLSEIEPLVGSLIANLSSLEDLVARRLDANERVRSLQREVFRANDETGRLLSPWTAMLEGQIARGSQDSEAASRLATALAQLRPIQTAQSRFSAAADMLAEASTTDQDRRLPILAFQLQRALRELDATAVDLAPKLRPLFQAQIGKLRTFAEGPQAITAMRKQELTLIGEGRKLLAENARLSARLAGAVDRLAAAAKEDVSDSTSAALSVQRLSTRLLVVLVALSLLTSALIVWLYVGRNIVRRLTGLSDGMLAIAAGRLDAPVAVRGGDEIAAMGRAVEVFRGNAIELGRLLEERKQAAARLEEVVEERTRELERRSAALRVTFENMGHGVVMFDRDRRMVAWNRHFQELLELPDDRVGHQILFEDFVRHIADRGEYGVCDVDALVESHLSSIDRSFVDERTRPNGTVLDIRRNPIPSGGFVSIYTDVTQERRAQALVELARARLTDAIESLSDGFALWDKDDRLVVFNSRCEALLNAADLFVVGTRFEDLIRDFHRSGRYA
ncbi:PAS-domain containing protein, partial [Reyranella sp.]|uniref:PAS-domain containing protein n=1 Tax=Reyranella sp. TaxID=1929291 RepID=UPI002F94C756